MRIGIFGGSFNPPHIGHVQAAKNAAVQHKLDLLIVIPTGTPPHKMQPPNTPEPVKRLQMTKNAFNDSCNTIVSDIEVHSLVSNYTIDSVEDLLCKYPGAELFLLVGNDMYDTLDSWKDNETLLKVVTPVLLSRNDIPISSSEIRTILPERKGKNFLADINYAFIIKHRLYGAKPDWDWLRERAHEMLSPLRIPHVDACEIEALTLARRWGVDLDDAREAAILHDITKKLDFSENMCIIAEHGVVLEKLANHEEKLLHSITGSLLAQSVFGVSNDVADAIKWHTTGKAGMSMLEKVIYIADYIESTRDFQGVSNLRSIAYENINDAMIIGLKMTIDDLISRDITPNVITYQALNNLEM